MKLFYVPNTCAISPHIALIEAGLNFTLELVDLPSGKKLADGTSYLSVNPKGYVPALALDDGEILSEVAVIVQHIADLKPEAKLAPPNGTMARLRMQELLVFIATELHKNLSPLYQKTANDEFKTWWRANKVEPRLAHLERTLGSRAWLFGETFTVADAYAFHVLRWWQGAALKGDLTKWPALAKYWERLGDRPSVKTATEAQRPR